MNLVKKLTVLFIVIISLSNLGISVTNKVTKVSDEIRNGSTDTNSPQEVKETYCLGEVVKIISDLEEELPGGNKQRSQQLLLKITSGIDKGKKRSTLNLIPDNPAFSIICEVGKKYLITKVENLSTGDEDYYIVDYYREPYIWALLGAFLLTLIFVGGVKGIRTIISLLCTIAFVAFILIPSIVKGINPLLAAVVVSFLSTALTMVLVAGFNFKSLASTLGTVVGVAIGGIIATFVINNAPLSGLASSEAMILWGNQLYHINFKGLLAAGMIVSCLGAVMDVAISISSSIQEIKAANPDYSFIQLFASGMNVGKDIMGTMTSTLVLAYTGMALPLLILFSNESNPSKYLNLELIVSEITAAIAGSIGLIIAVPVTAVIMSYLISRVEKTKI